MNYLNELKINNDGIGILPSIGTMFQLNKTSKFIIDLIKQNKTKEEIVEEISKEYNKDWEKVYIDVEDFFLKLKLLGLYNE